RVDVARIHILRQRTYPGRNRLGVRPILVHEGEALAEHGVIMRVAELRAALDAGHRHAGLDGGEFERQRRGWITQPRQRICFGTLHVNLDERGWSVPQEKGIEGYHWHIYRACPYLPFPARRAISRRAERLRGGRNRWIVDVDAECSYSRFAAHSDGFDRHGRI